MMIHYDLFNTTNAFPRNKLAKISYNVNALMISPHKYRLMMRHYTSGYSHIFFICIL